MCETERLAMFRFWREVGLRMDVRAIPEDYTEFERYNIDCERRHYRFTETNRRVGAATVEMFASWFARPLRPLVRQAIYALLDDAVIAGFGFPQPSPAMRQLVDGVLRMRARLLRFLPARRRPRLRTEMRHRSYPAGYRIEELGPPIASRPDAAAED